MYHFRYKTLGTTAECGQWPWLRDWAGTAAHTWRAENPRPACLGHSSHPTGELSQQSCILYLLNSYFRKFNTNRQMNANYTSIAQLKLETLSTGSCSNPSHSPSCSHIKRLVSGPQGLAKSPWTNSPAWGNATCTHVRARTHGALLVT